VQILDHGVHDGVPYLAMECLEGEPRTGGRRRRRNGPWSTPGDLESPPWAPKPSSIGYNASVMSTRLTLGEWLYKATTARRSFEATRDLALSHGFIVRSLHKAKPGPRGAHAKVQNVRNVQQGDILHLYYRHGRKSGGKVEPIGSFRVLGAAEDRERFAPADERGALVRVNEVEEAGALLEALRAKDDGKGYLPDPQLGAFTGWRVERLPKEPPEYTPDLFPTHAPQITLCRYERPSGEGIALSRITFDPNVMGGKPCIRGMRVTAGAVVELVAAGHDVGEILQLYPYLEAEDITQALRYAAWRAEEIELPLSA
jgi:uncharacterized protein (DUF433 family)